MEKKFKIKDNHLEVEVTQSDIIYLPTENGKKNIGTYSQTTIQNINPEEINTLLEFVKSENAKAEKQLDLINKELDKIEVEDMDQDVVMACKKQIDKGSKVFKQKMLTLNNHLELILKKKSLTTQKEYVEKQLVQMRKELADLEAEIKTKK